MIDNMSEIPLPPVSMEQALANIVESISREENAVANVLNSESEVIQKIKEADDNIEDIVCLNESVNDVIKNLVKLQMLLQIKLEEAKTFLCKISDYKELGE